MTPNAETSKTFHPQVIPSHLESVDMPGADGNPMTDHMFERGEGGGAPYFDAGMMEMSDGAEAPTHWLHDIQVEDLDATLAKSQEPGATIHAPAMDIAGVGRIVVPAEPFGASFAVYKGAPQPPACEMRSQD